jgi:UDP-N-acetylmuramate dehydrogenase
MIINKDASLLRFNTFGVEAKADYIVEYDSVVDLQKVLSSEIAKSNRILPVGSGSNLLFLNDFKGLILQSRLQSIAKLNEDEESVIVEAGSGVVWDDFVAYCVENGWGGVENLSLIPGEVGAAAVQNIGAYGVEVQDIIVEVNTVEIKSAEIRKFSTAECHYGYRNSIFKNEFKGQFIVTSVVFKLSKTPKFVLNYQHLEEEVLKNGAVNLQNVRKTIIAVRESKLPNPKSIGNAGSFFMNPVISKQHFLELQSNYPYIPHYFVSETEEKIPAGWLIEQCGWKGKNIGNAGVHDKQALVLVNRGGATGAEIVFLAEQIHDSVKKKFSVELIPEVNYIY